ncbi:hypothetical protein [Acinetobacter sp. WCHAc010034]|uniref:hypothetical protein n=1 Tax=Acinetobacter sp. WCHAc010034 TaxID=1879049 RepID=UPI0013C3339C|nr:hypothetical protein [Acinetobacter sp. WCHAc010034]
MEMRMAPRACGSGALRRCMDPAAALENIRRKLACGIAAQAICAAGRGAGQLKLSENLRILLYFCYAMRLPFY